MKNSKLIATIFAFTFAIVGAFASQSPILLSETTGVRTGACSTAVSLNEGTCYINGTSTQCTITVSNQNYDAFATTNCTSPLRISQ